MTSRTVTTKPRPVAKPSTSDGGKGKKLMRHIVKLDENGKPSDECLCGHVWDKVFLSHGDEICQKCVDLSKQYPRT